MDFRTIDTTRVSVIKGGVHYGANKGVSFQMPRTTYNVSSSSSGLSWKLTGRLPAEFVAFLDEIGAACNVFDRFDSIYDDEDTVVFDESGAVTEPPPKGSIVDATLVVNVRRVTGAGKLFVVVRHGKVYDTTHVRREPLVVIDGKRRCLS